MVAHMGRGVSPAREGSHPIGEVESVFDGVYQLKLPVPFPLKFVSSYLIEGRDGWTIIDPGFDYPPARAAWESAAAKIGLELDRDIERIVVTHLHPDHIGLARLLQEESGAPVWMLDQEISNARRMYDPTRGSEEFREYMIRNGMHPETANSTAGGTKTSTKLPESLTPIYSGDVFELGHGEARVIHTPGHSDFHFVLHDERRQLMFAGDHVLLKITPNIGRWTNTDPEPLERYLSSLKSLKGLSVNLVLPGHGPLFHDLDGRIDELVQHHEERLSVMHSAFNGQPATAFEIASRVFADDLTDHQLRFALAETVAHLEYLNRVGCAERLDGDVVTYHAI